MRFQLAPRSMTLDDLEQLSSHYPGISRDFTDLEVNEDRPVLSAAEL